MQQITKRVQEATARYEAASEQLDSALARQATLMEKGERLRPNEKDELFALSTRIEHLRSDVDSHSLVLEAIRQDAQGEIEALQAALKTPEPTSEPAGE